MIAELKKPGDMIFRVREFPRLNYFFDELRTLMNENLRQVLRVPKRRYSVITT